MNQLTIHPGRGKDQRPEAFAPLVLGPGDLCAVAGNTGSGKSRLIKDIEQLVNGESPTGRRILLDGKAVPFGSRQSVSGRLVAHLSQSMRFVLDLTVMDFLALHCRCRDQTGLMPKQILDIANTITPEPVFSSDHLNLLSGGQSRALMIADIALVCDSPVILIDEIEKALHLLTNSKKLVLIVTHDPHTALMARKRIIMDNGAVRAVLARTPEETRLFARLDQVYEEQMLLQSRLRKGETLI